MTSNKVVADWDFYVVVTRRLPGCHWPLVVRRSQANTGGSMTAVLGDKSVILTLDSANNNKTVRLTHSVGFHGKNPPRFRLLAKLTRQVAE